MATTNTAALDPNAVSTVGGTNTNPNTSQVTVGVNQQQSSGSVANSGAIGQAAAAGTMVTPGSVQAKQGSNLLGNLSDAYSTGKTLFGGLNKAVDGFGQSLGFANPYLQGPTASGAALGSQAGSLGTTASLGQALGGAGFGFAAGGFISSLVGGNPMGGSIGGALGGLAGSVFLSGLTTGIGAELGATLGSVVPGIGTVIGAVAGSLLGGMFGGKKPNPAGVYANVAIGNNGALSGGGLEENNSKHMSGEDFNPYVSDFSTYLQSQSKKYGLTNLSPDLRTNFSYDVNGTIVEGDSDNNSRIAIYNPKTGQSYGSYLFNPNDNGSKQNAYNQAWNSVLQGSGIDPATLSTSGRSNGESTVIPKIDNPSTWQAFLDKYRSEHTTPQPTTPQQQV